MDRNGEQLLVQSPESGAVSSVPARMLDFFTRTLSAQNFVLTEPPGISLCDSEALKNQKHFLKSSDASD